MSDDIATVHCHINVTMIYAVSLLRNSCGSTSAHTEVFVLTQYGLYPVMEEVFKSITQCKNTKKKKKVKKSC